MNEEEIMREADFNSLLSTLSNMKQTVNSNVFIVGPIDNEKAQQALAEIHAIESSGSALLNLVLSTPGGETDAALSIYDALLTSSIPSIACCTYGECKSAGVLLLQAADYRMAGPNTRFLIHKGSLEFAGSMNDLEIHQKEFDVFTKTYRDAILSRTKLTAKKLDRMHKSETFFGAEDAKRMGFIDKILPARKFLKKTRK